MNLSDSRRAYEKSVDLLNQSQDLLEQAFDAIDPVDRMYAATQLRMTFRQITRSLNMIVSGGDDEDA